jgi:hypothetical protein
MRTPVTPGGSSGRYRVHRHEHDRNAGNQVGAIVERVKRLTADATIRSVERLVFELQHPGGAHMPRLA